MEARGVHNNTLLRVPPVPNNPGVDLSSFQETRHGVSSADQNNIISIEQAIEPQPIIQALWRLLKSWANGHANLT
jgi:hypothetical protein